MHSFVWHPYTQMNEWPDFDIINQGKGMWLYSTKRKKMLDGVASMWCNVWGHSKTELVDSIIRQSKQLQHSSLFNLTNDKAEALAEKLVKLAPGMHRVFYSDNGSTAMEISAKMALQYWHNIGEKKRKTFVTFENGYHGDTAGSMSLGYVPGFFSIYKPMLFSTIRTPSPISYRVPHGYSYQDYQEFCLEEIENVLKKRHDVAAFVIESGAQVAGGVVIYPPRFQKKISQLCKKYNTLFVLDEIATVFGRLGSMIEYKAQQSMPDIVSFGKMLSGGYIPIAVTLANKKVYDAFLGQYHEMKHFFHGHTFTGNPLACSVSLTNLALYKKNKIISTIQKRALQFSKRIDEISSLDIVGDVRHKGMLMGIDLVSDKKIGRPISPKKKIHQKIFVEARRRGVYLRTLGSIVMLVPPLAISEKELDFLLDTTISTIKGVSKNIGI